MSGRLDWRGEEPFLDGRHVDTHRSIIELRTREEWVPGRLWLTPAGPVLIEARGWRILYLLKDSVLRWPSVAGLELRRGKKLNRIVGSTLPLDVEPPS